MRGRADFVDSDELPATSHDRPEPWPEGVRPLHVRITPRTVTGGASATETGAGFPLWTSDMGVDAARWRR